MKVANQTTRELLGVVLEGRGLEKTYGSGSAAIAAVRGVDIALQAGQVTTLMGPSGSGKSTLLHLLAGLETPSVGTVHYQGGPLADLSEDELARWRAEHAGFVLQRNNLIPTLNVAENVAAPQILAGERRQVAMERARAALTDVGLAGRVSQFPTQLSGGEAARAAVARACLGSPSIIFADEPTGNLDRENGAVVLDLLISKVRATGAAALIVSHDQVVADAGDRVLRLVDGRVDDIRAAAPSGPVLTLGKRETDA
jgi:predicted ABC-type transport system involved in lysophospholipase L1 biosynthesis ATPase subunit